jgi:hypothetical protein
VDGDGNWPRCSPEDCDVIAIPWGEPPRPSPGIAGPHPTRLECA